MNQRSALSGEDLERAVQMKKEGASYPEIAREFGISQSTAHKHVSPIVGGEAEGKGPKKRKSEKKKEEGGKMVEVRKVLTDEGFQRASELYREGKDFSEIAFELNAPKSLVESELRPHLKVLDSFRRIEERKSQVEEAIRNVEAHQEEGRKRR